MRTVSTRDGDTTRRWPEPKVHEHWHAADRRALEMMRLTVAKIDADRSLLGIGTENLNRRSHPRGGERCRRT